MSTIRKIEKMHRARATERVARQFYFAAVALSGPRTVLGLIAAETFKILERLRKDSSKTGADKDRLHAAIMTGWEANKVKISDQMRASAEVKPNDTENPAVSDVHVDVSPTGGVPDLVSPTATGLEQPTPPTPESN